MDFDPAKQTSFDVVLNPVDHPSFEEKLYVAEQAPFEVELDPFEVELDPVKQTPFEVNPL